MEGGQETGGLSAFFLHRSNSVGNDGRKRKERSSTGAGELQPVKRREDSTAYIIIEAMEAANHQYKLLERITMEKKHPPEYKRCACKARQSYGSARPRVDKKLVK